ncbi:MAG: hypothetical protein HKN24_10290 [Acidimicrobiales bacterium]|nr:hypothetical protein [Acidimicrobiales bacterium]
MIRQNLDRRDPFLGQEVDVVGVYRTGFDGSRNVRDLTTRDRSRARTAHSHSRLDALAWWRLWGVAAIAHVVGTFAADVSWRSVANTLLAVVAIVVVRKPSSALARTGLSAGIVCSAIVETPVIGNHWLVAAGVSAAALVARPWDQPGDWFARFAPTGRLLLLVFYSFAAFSKLNSGFFDPVTSCARFFANRPLELFGLPTIGGEATVAALLPVLAAAIEISVPILLMITATRRIGLWIAIAFHLLLTIDVVQHFFDFTLLLLPLFLLFAAPGELSAFDRRLPRGRHPQVWTGIALSVVLGATFPLAETWRGLALLFVWATWAALALLIVRFLFSGPDGAANLSLRPVGSGAMLIAALFVLNGISPYLELKTATAFNMYSNLVTRDGTSNHFVVRTTLPIRSAQSNPLVIVDSTDPGLREYAEEGLVIVPGNLRSYLETHEVRSVVVETASGEVLDLSSSDRERADEVLGPPPSRLLQRVAPYRSFPTSGACHVSWHAAL